MWRKGGATLDLAQEMNLLLRVKLAQRRSVDDEHGKASVVHSAVQAGSYRGGQGRAKHGGGGGDTECG